jgi:hypothetical protein
MVTRIRFQDGVADLSLEKGPGAAAQGTAAATPPAAKTGI